MGERFELYYRLIDQLLACPEGEELELLQANSDLVDLWLLCAMQWVVDHFAENENSNTAEFLRSIAQKIVEAMGFSSIDEMYQEYFDCLIEILEAVEENPNAELVYPLLKKHLDKLNLNLGFVLYIWEQKTVSTLGNSCRNRIPVIQWISRKISQIIRTLLKHESLESTQAQGIAKVVFNFGNLIQKFPLGNVANKLELAIIAYQVVFNINIYTETDFSYDWAMILNNLGRAYNKRIRGDKAENLEKAIAACEKALRIYTETNFPVEWAMIQNNLAIAHHNRIREDKAENLEKAIKYCENALRIRTETDFPYDWAATQNHLAIVYSKRIRGDKADNLEKAIAAYKNALHIYTETNFSYEWAMIQNNLALTYSQRIRRDKADNLEKAIALCENALRIRTETDFPVDWTITQENLANAYIERIRGDKAENLEKAIKYCENALRIRTETDFPVDWATTQNSLAIAYSARVRGDRAENLEKAVEYFQNTLRIFTETDFPTGWATTQSNLANAYTVRIKGNKAENLERAIECFENALCIYTQTDFPIDCLRTATNLGNLHFIQGNWELAIQTYQKAISAIEITRNWATNDTRRQEIIADSMDVYEKMIQACLNNGQVDLAIETTERSRARHLVDLMASNDLYQGEDIPETVREYLEQYEHLQERINFLRSSSQSSDNRELATSETRWRNSEVLSAEIAEITNLEAEKQQIWQQLRCLDPILAGQQQVDPISFTQIQQLIDNNSTAILCCYSTWEGTYIFILYKDKLPQVHTCKGQKINILHGEFLGDNWLSPYLQDFSTWQNNIPKILEELAQRLQLDELIEKHLQGIEELIIIPHLWLHQIPFAALPVNSIPLTPLKRENLAQNSLLLGSSLERETDTRGMVGKAKASPTFIPEDRQYLGDLFRLRILPSCQILNYCHQRPTLNGQNTMGIVENATGDLPYTAYECEILTNKYQVEPSKRLQQSRATLGEYRKIASQVSNIHSSHHASANSENPLESALILSDGNLTLGALLTPGWRRVCQNLSDVYLNNCETNFSINEITDDLLSIATGFLCAGARSVVSTLWSVDDCASALLAIFYYEFRHSGSSRPQALQQAQQKLRNLTGKQLQEEYLSQLKANLSQQYQQAIANLENALDSEEKEKNRQFADKIQRQIEHTLPVHCQSTYPFASPFYWAGFISQGLA